MGKKKPEEVANAAAAPDASKPDEEEDTAIIKTLKAIDDKFCAIECEYEAEVRKLRKKVFEEKQAPLLAERAKVLVDTTGAPAEDHEFGTPACKGFWLKAFQNCDAFAEALEEWDEPVIEYLQDIKKSDLDAENSLKGFKLEFVFKENPYFSNTSLSLEFHVDYDPATYKPYLEPKLKELKGTAVEWKDGKNITVELVSKKTKGGGAKKAKQKAKAAKEEPRESFFRLMFRNLKVGDEMPADLKAMFGGGEDDEDDDDEMVPMMLEQLHGIGIEISDSVVPFAVRFYTGEAGDMDSDDDEDGESEEDDDDDDDEDSDDEPPAPKKKGQKAGGAGKAAAAAGGQKQEECKQQ